MCTVAGWFLLKRMSHFESTVHIGVILLKLRSYRLVDLKWQTVLNNMCVILLKRIGHFECSDVYVWIYILEAF
jgi:hypothetical protein